jgi:FkbM family methyltransferase
MPDWWRLLRLLPAWLPGRTRTTRALLRLFHRLERIDEDHGMLVPGAGGVVWAVPSIHEPVAQALICAGIYEPHIHHLVATHLPADGVLIDVGANVGSLALPMARTLSPRGTVLALEGSSRIHSYLCEGAERSRLPCLRIVNCAVGPDDWPSVRFHDAPRSKFGMGSLSASRFGGGPSHPVPMRSLDSLVAELSLRRCDVIKVDVEGYELGVFQGARRVLERLRPMIVFEFCDWAEDRPEDGVHAGDAQRFLTDLNYRIFTLGEFVRGGLPLQDSLCRGSADLVAIPVAARTPVAAVG